MSVSVRPFNRLWYNISNRFLRCCFGISLRSDSTGSTCIFVVDSSVLSTTSSDGKSSNAFHFVVVILNFPCSGSTPDCGNSCYSSNTGWYCPGIWSWHSCNNFLIRRMDWGVMSSLGGVNQLTLSANCSYSVGSLRLIIIMSPLKFSGIVIQLPLWSY